MKENKKTGSIISTVYVLLAGMMWGIIGLFVRNLNGSGLSSMCIVFIRSLSATLIMGAFLLVYNRKLFRIRIKDIWCFVGTGIISLSFFNICYFTTINMTSLSVAAILLYTAPSMVMIMSLFIFKEKMNAKKIVSVILAFIGCMMVTGIFSGGGSNTLSPIGILVGLGAGFGYAMYSIFARFALNKGYSSFTVTFYTLAFSVIGSVVFFEPQKTADVLSENPVMILFMLAFGLVTTVLPYIFYTLGLSGMESGRASIIASIEPVTATILGIVVFHEKTTLLGILGALVVLLSIFIVNVNEKNGN